ncbi:MAG: IS3 family transposase [Azoarcus sp.]|nr:IS3 family transposase [Azoarcus sp.]
MKYAFIEQERTCYPIRVLCRVLAVSVSGFYDHRQRRSLPRQEAELALRTALRTLHAGSRGTYGRPRLVRGLRAGGHAVGHRCVARLMREEGLHGKLKGHFKPQTTDSQHSSP